MDEKEEGLLLGELKEFRKMTLMRLSNIEKDVKALTSFKWKLTGITIGVVFLFEVAVTVIRLKGM